ncbi:conserved hypothetical protein [Trichinella spiralis]|uniref:hypothetical protein n=1 Tax=Trichinella spiralis TaxID=6334 RepID=UPI0001EFBF57|nr:conserved hypothetical protein [Trichinella spiralis]
MDLSSRNGLYSEAGRFLLRQWGTDMKLRHTIPGGTSDAELLRAVEVEADAKRLQSEGVDGGANRVMILCPPPMRRSDQSAIRPAGGRTGTQCRRAVGAVRVRRR